MFEYMCMPPLDSKTVVIRRVLQLINSVAKFASPSTGTGLGECFRCVKLKVLIMKTVNYFKNRFMESQL